MAVPRTAAVAPAAAMPMPTTEEAQAITDLSGDAAFTGMWVPANLFTKLLGGNVFLDALTATGEGAQ